MKKILTFLTVISVLFVTVSTVEAATKATKTTATKSAKQVAPAKTAVVDVTPVKRDIPYKDRAIELNSSDYALSLPDRTYIPGTDFKREEYTTTYTDETGTHTEKTYRELDIRNNKYDLLFSDTKPEFRRFLYQNGDARATDGEVPATNQNTYKASAQTNADTDADMNKGMTQTSYSATDYGAGTDLKLILNDKKTSKTILFPQK